MLQSKLPIDVSAMAYPYDEDEQALGLDLVDHAIISDADPVDVFKSAELRDVGGAGVLGEPVDAPGDPLTLLVR